MITGLFTAPETWPFGVAFALADERENVRGVPLGIEIADHIGPFTGSSDGRAAAPRAVRQAFNTDNGEVRSRLGRSPFHRRQKTRPGPRLAGRCFAATATGHADIERG